MSMEINELFNFSNIHLFKVSGKRTREGFEIRETKRQKRKDLTNHKTSGYLRRKTDRRIRT